MPTDEQIDTAFGEAQSAVDAYDRMQQALRNGDWSSFGEAMEELGIAIESLR